MATNSQPKLQITSPYVTGSPNKAASQVVLYGQTNTSATDNSKVQINAGSFELGSTKFSRPNVLVSFSKSIPNNAVTQLDNASFTIIRDTYSLYNNGLFVTDRAGTWEVGIYGRYDAQGAVVGYRQVRCQLNGVDFLNFSLPPTAALNGVGPAVQMIWRDQLGANTLIGFQGFQNSGVASTFGSGGRAWMSLIEEL